MNADGRKNGLGAILFEDQAEAEEAVEKLSGEYIGARFVKLAMMDYGTYSNFNAGTDGVRYVPGGDSVRSSQGLESAGKLSQCVNADNLPRSLLMRGCPWKVTPEEIISFFKDFGTMTTNDIFIEDQNGRRTGKALVVFDSAETAQDARHALHR